MSSQCRTFTIDFHIEQKVKVHQLFKEGVVIAVYMDGSGIKYNVRYFAEDEAKEVYFYAWELEEVE